MHFVAFALVLLLCGLAVGQLAGSHKAGSGSTDEFSRPKDLSSDLKDGSVFVFPKPTYSLKRKIRPVKPVAAVRIKSKNSDSAKTDAKSIQIWKRIGVTIWQLAANPPEGQTASAAVIKDTAGV